MHQEQSLRDTYNTIAQDWHRDHQKDTWWQEGTDYFLSLLSPHATVLDAGCAGGYKTKYIGERGFDVEGIDLSDEFIAIAQNELPQYRFTQMDLRHIDQLPHSYDAIYTSAVLLHIPKNEVPSILKKFHAKLHPDGYLYIAVKAQKPGGVEEEVKTENDYGYAYDRFFSYFSKDEMQDWLTESGFTVRQLTEKAVGGTNWIQIIAQRA